MKHPNTQPLVVQFAEAKADDLRAALLLATPFAILSECQMVYFAALRKTPFDHAKHYLEAVTLTQNATRDEFGRLPVHIEEIYQAARLTLCTHAGSVRLIPPET